MGPWNGCYQDAADCRRTQQDPRPKTGGGSQVTITKSVGVGGVNLRPDVLEIQKALNRIPESQGGPRPPLVEDSWYGQLTGGAIRKFQTVQFPGWLPDGKIDAGQKTLKRINEILSDGAAPAPEVKLTGPAYAYQSVPDALARVNKAIARLSAVRTTYLLADTLFGSKAERRAVEWHFKVHKANDPVAQIDRVLAIYDLIRLVLNGANLSRLFQTGRADGVAVAYTASGGYFVKPGQPTTPADEPDYYIYVPPQQRAGSLVIIHELGHYCGGKAGSGREIDHRATPIPSPKGKALEHGQRNYWDMTADDAYLNTHSYQAYAFPEQPFGKVPDNF